MSLQTRYLLSISFLAHQSGNNSPKSSFQKQPLAFLYQVPFLSSLFELLIVDIILEESLLRSSLNDPLYPQYIDHALKVHLLPPIDVLSSLAAVIPDLQNYSESVRYPIVRLLSQALELWRPFPQSNKRELDVFWTVVSAVHQLVVRENLRRDNLIPIESLDTLNKLLTLPSLRPIFKAQRDKENNGTLYVPCLG